MLYNLIYSSTATHEFEYDELVDILNTAKDFNEQHDITGMLLYKNRQFLQVLEGDKHVITDLYEKIRIDPRHHQVHLIGLIPIRKRLFDDWEMGFIDLETNEHQHPDGYSDFLNTALNSNTFRDDSSLAHNFLKMFKRKLA